MPRDSEACDTGDRNDEIARLRREVRSLRDEIAGRDAGTAPRSSRRMTITGGVCAGVAAGALLIAASPAIDLPAAPGWTTIASLLPTRAAVGIVERIFTVY